MQQTRPTSTFQTWRNMPLWTPNHVSLTLMAAPQLCLVRRKPKGAPCFSQVRCHRESAASFLARVPYSMKRCRNSRKCTVFLQSHFVAKVLYVRSLSEKVSNCGALGKKRRNNVFWCFPRKSKANHKFAAQSTHVSFIKKRRKSGTYFLQIVAFFLTHTIGAKLRPKIWFLLQDSATYLSVQCCHTHITNLHCSVIHDKGMAFKWSGILGCPALKWSWSAIGLQNGTDGFNVSWTVLKQTNNFLTV